MKRLRSSGTVAAIDPSGSTNVLQQITDMLKGIQGDVSQIITEYNTEVYTTISTLPQGKSDPRWNLPSDTINPRINDLDGANVFVDTEATSISNAGRFWYSTANESRPTTIKESLLDLYTEITTSLDTLRQEINSISLGGSVAIYDNSLSSSSIVEDVVQSIVFSGVGVTSSSIGSGAVRVSVAGTGSEGVALIIGNSVSGDTSDNCHVLDVGNGVNLKSAIEGATADTDVFIRRGTYDLGLNPSSSPTITIPAGVKVRGAGRGHTTITTPSASSQTAFNLSSKSELSDLTISVVLPLGTCSGSFVVGMNGVNSQCSNIHIGFLGTYTGTEMNYSQLIGCFGGSSTVDTSGSRIIHCSCGESSPRLPYFTGVKSDAEGLAAVVIGSYSGITQQMEIDHLIAYGGDYGVVIQSPCNVCSSDFRNFYRYGCWAKASSYWCQVSSNKFDAYNGTPGGDYPYQIQNGFLADSGGWHCILGNIFNRISIPQHGTAINLNGTDECIISSNNCYGGWGVGVNLSSGADNNVVNSNQMSSGVAIPYQDSGTGNDVAHNK